MEAKRTKEKKRSALLSKRIANLWFSFSRWKNRSTTLRFLYCSLSISHGLLYVFLQGIQGLPPFLSIKRRNLREQWALSAMMIVKSRESPSKRFRATLISLTLPALKNNLIGRHCLSTAAWILVLLPPLLFPICRSSPFLRLIHGDVLWQKWSQDSTLAEFGLLSAQRISFQRRL